MTLRLRFFQLIFALLASLSGAQAVTLTSEEQQLANLLTTASGQQRDKSAMHLDERLVQVARARAADMAKRGYFDHVNPDGNGPNYLVRAAGYALPASWPTDRKLNYIESIGGGYMSAQECWTELLKSTPHRTHLLAQDSFYRNQTSYGIGHYYDPKSTYWHYWVIITAPPAPVSALSIAAPLAGSKVTSSTVNVRGSVSGGGMFSALQLRLDTPAGVGDWTNLSLPSQSGVGAWTASVSGLQSGVNTIRVRVLNASGGVARESSAAVRLVVLKPLSVSIEGEGKVNAGFAGTTLREIGAAYTLRAFPAAGYIFDQWSGLPQTQGRDIHRATQAFVMAEGLTIAVHFIPNPFPALAANYSGLIGADGATPNQSGSFFLKVTPGGAASGRLVFAGGDYPLLVRFNSAGEASIRIARPGKEALLLSLNLDVSGVDQAVTGTLSDGVVNYEIRADRSVSTEAARFTVRVEPDAAAAPQGYGYAMVTMRADGIARITGLLADGQSFSRAAYFLADGRLPLHIPLAGGKSALHGSLQINGGDVDGSLRCDTSEGSTVHHTPGSQYVPPAAGVSCVQFGGSSGGKVNLSDGDIADAVNHALTTNANNRITLAAPAPAGWKITVNPLNGRFRGTFVHPLGGLRNFSGVVSQKDGAGWGFFPNTGESGVATLGAQ